MNKSIMALFIFLFPLLCFSKENRCGWLENPSPANYWLTDKDGEWTISTQGKQGAAGMDKLIGFSNTEFIKTNGEYGYGYGCACITVDSDHNIKKILTIYQFKALTIRQCKIDKTLKRKTKDIMTELREN